MIKEAVFEGAVPFLLGFRAGIVNRQKLIPVQREAVLKAIADHLSLNQEVRRELVCAIMILG